MSQGEVATEMTALGLGWHQTTVAKTEAGTRPLKLVEALGLALVLRLPQVDDILGADSPVHDYVLNSFVRRERVDFEEHIESVRMALKKQLGQVGVDVFDEHWAAAEAAAKDQESELIGQRNEVERLLDLLRGEWAKERRAARDLLSRADDLKKEGEQ